MQFINYNHPKRRPALLKYSTLNSYFLREFSELTAAHETI